MSKSIAAIHVARKELGLDDETYRAALVQVTGKSSSADMSEAERQKVLERFRQQGFKGYSKGARKPLEGRFAKKLQALWIAGYNLGLVKDRDDRALLAFVKRQTGIDHVRFLRHADDAAKAIEALKAWLARAGGVDWHAFTDPADCVLSAQIRKLGSIDAGYTMTVADGASAETVQAVSGMAKHAMMNVLGERIRALPAGAK